jgi:hypothetical protein
VLSAWRRRTNVWREETSPSPAARLLRSDRQRGAIPPGVCEFGKTRCGISAAVFHRCLTARAALKLNMSRHKPDSCFCLPVSRRRWLSFAYQCKKVIEMTSAVVEQIKTNNGNEVVKSLMDKERARSKADAPQIAAGGNPPCRAVRGSDDPRTSGSGACACQRTKFVVGIEMKRRWRVANTDAAKRSYSARSVVS